MTASSGVETDQQNSKPATVDAADLHSAPDAMVCYCYGLTASMLRKKHAEAGSLKALQACCKAGKGCGGCRVVLQSMFNEEIEDMYKDTLSAPVGTPCAKPGSKIMTSFIIAAGDLESKVYSCNAVAPQLGDCNATTNYDYAIVNPKGKVVGQKSGTLTTNETFCFDTRTWALPRPFYGMFVMGLGRGNYGASRFNVQWGNSVSVTATHEISVTGRPRVFLPIFVSKSFVRTENDIFLAIMNPRTAPVKFLVVVFDPDTGNRLAYQSELGPFQSTWINATEYLYKPAIEQWPGGRFAIKVDTVELGHEEAVSVYFFFRNHATNQWSSQHL